MLLLSVRTHKVCCTFVRCRTDFVDIQNKKECAGNRQWQRRFLRNWAANVKGRVTYTNLFTSGKLTTYLAALTDRHRAYKSFMHSRMAAEYLHSVAILVKLGQYLLRLF